MSLKQNDIFLENTFDFLFEQGMKVEQAKQQPTIEELKKSGCQTYREAREKGIII